MSNKTIDEFVRLFVAGDAHGMLALCRPDALLDVNIPKWRYQARPEAVLSGLRENTEMPDRSVSVGFFETAGRVGAVEVETRGTYDGGRVLIREAWMLRTEGDRIVEWISYCTAPWDAATIERHAAEATMLHA